MIDLNANQEPLETIAIIGLSCRLPGANNLEKFWRNLCDGVESISFFSVKDSENFGIYQTWLNDHSYVKADPVIEGVDLFDASFFNFSPRQAKITSPEHRIFLECAWAALESAGYVSENYKGSIGVYAGSNLSHYLEYANQKELLRRPSMAGVEASFGNDLNYLATQVSYQLNLYGPSLMVQTACSTALVAIHVANQSLLNGECDMALAGAINIKIPPGYFYQEGGIFSPDGHCRAFDAKSQGTVPGSGAGIVVLKRLSDALADGDHIYAVIKGSAINNDGSSKVGYTAPSIDSQAATIADALAIANIEPKTVTYIEAHGTGTALGDPIEIAALTEVFRASTDEKSFCAIGSVKTNLGHLGVAAGIPSLMKTALALKHKMIPPSLHFEKPNPKIDFANSPFYVNNNLSDWKTNGTPRRAGVTCLGVGGTNAHLILEEAPSIKTSGTSRPWKLLVLSAKTSSALETATAKLTQHLKQHPDINLADVAYTLQLGRRAFDHRRMLVCQNLDEAVKALENLEPQRVFSHYQEASRRLVVFMFSGQGTQYVNMAQELYQNEPIFREQVDICSERLKPHLGLDLRHILYPSPEQTEEASGQLQQTAITQPALFVIEYALAQLWREWGVVPTAMIGHSIGEYVAATLAGVFSLEDALALVAARGKLMQQLPCGSMLAVPLSEAQVQPFLGKELSLAAINGTSSCVISGVKEAVEVLESKLAAQGLECRRLHTSHAFHSPMMEPILESFTQQVKKVSFQPPQIPYISNVTGTWITAEQATEPSYWVSHLRQTVRLASGLQELLKQPAQILLEIGPGRTLTALAKRHPDHKSEQVVLSSLRHPQEAGSDVAFLLNTLGQLWLNEGKVDWSGFYTHERRHRLPLPTYPFERQRYWIEPPQLEQDNCATQVSLGKQPDIADWFYMPLWKQSVPPVPIKPGELVAQKSCTLVFIDECGLGSNLVKRLRKEGQDVITVQVGTEFTQLSESLYTLNPQQDNDYDILLKELLAQKKLPERIVHFWSVTPVSPPESGLVGVEKAQDTGFYSLLFLAQALGKQNLTEAFQITVVSNNMQPVTGEESLSPEKATLLGPVKVIPQEYPNISCRSIDVVLPPSGSWQQEKLTEQLLTELRVPTSEQVIAYRGNNRWLQTFEPVRLDKSLEEKARLREGGVYLITGGLGGIGLVLAEHLAKTVQAKLILTGRSVFPAREEWENWLLTHDETDSISRKIRQVQELEELGAEVLVVSADVANLAQMKDALADAQLHFGQLNGVIHAAGILGEKSFAAIVQTSKIECEQQFQPKVYGLLVLENLLQNKELDFCILLSSLSSVLGGLGYVAYGAANLFMDALTHQHNQTNPVPWLSVNWDAWQVDKGQKETTYLDSSLAKFLISSKEGIIAFKRILSWSNFNQVVVSTGNLSSRLHQWIQPKNLGDGDTSKKSSLHPRPDLQSSYVAPRNETEQKLADIWQELLGLDQVGIHDNFFELGGDSLLIVQVRSKLQETFNKGFLITDSFQYPTISDLAEYISGEKFEQPAFQQANDRAKRQQDALEEEVQLIKQRRKARG